MKRKPVDDFQGTEGVVDRKEIVVVGDERPIFRIRTGVRRKFRKRLARTQVVVAEPQLESSVENIRPAETMVIGDLNGSLRVFKNALICLGALGFERNNGVVVWKWLAGNRRLVLVGDILADRNPEGLMILDRVRELRKQAVEQGGSITIVCGNHEDIAISFLGEKFLANPSKNTYCRESLDALNHAILPRYEYDEWSFYWQGYGILELISKYTDYGREFEGDLLPLQVKIELDCIDNRRGALAQLGAEAKRNMQNSPTGREYLEEICAMKLIDLDGDSLILHTEPSGRILACLTAVDDIRIAVENINNHFQNGLKTLLMPTNGVETPENRFIEVGNVFLEVNNRLFQARAGDAQIEAYLKKLSKMGIKRIIHGHSTVDESEPHEYVAHGVQIVNVDFGAGRSGYDPDSQQVATLATKGELSLGQKAVRKRSEKPV
jgi:hypothetical protein